MDYKNLKILIWDIDGVLIHVRESYREAIVETSGYYIRELMGIKTNAQLLAVEDTQSFKLVGGFNDDWKLTYAFVLCLLTKLVSQNRGLLSPHEKTSNKSWKLDLLKKAGNKVSNTDLALDYGKITTQTAALGGGLDGLEKVLSGMFGADCVDAAKRLWFTDIIKQVFQEMYLGAVLYKKKYRVPPYFVRQQGLIRHERPIISLNTLEKLSELFVMGVATGRERFEAEFSLREYGFDSFIPLEFMVTCEEVSKGKPDPEALILCRDRILSSGRVSADLAKAVYVGDSVDDIRAAKNAGFFSVGCLSASATPEEKRRLRAEFVRLNCDLIVNDANHLAVWVR